MKSFVPLLLVLLPYSTGFIFSERIEPKTGLLQLVDFLPQQRLGVNLNIGDDKGISRLPVRGLILDLKNEIAMTAGDMPGKNGPNPHLSSGVRTLGVDKEGHFISRIGTEIVHVANGCWEMIWRDNAPSGTLVCGLDIAEEYQRNDARLPKGRTYISFTVWTKDTFQQVQQRKKEILNEAEKYLKQREEELAKMQATDNIFMKALHFRNAYSAAEMYYFQPLEGIHDVPDTLEKVIAIHDNLFIHPTGLVWSQHLPHGKHVVLGSAGLVPVV